jgi:hypothetical protein
MRKGATGYPLSTPMATSALFNGLTDMVHKGKGSDDIVQELANRLRFCEIAASRLPVPGQSDAGALFPSEVHRHTVWNFSSFDAATLLPDDRPLTILVIDEARQLLDGSFPEIVGRGDTMFRLLRKALHRYCTKDKNSNLFMVLLDTSSKITNFLPSLEMDPSARSAFEEPALLIPPFIFHGSFDVFFKKQPKGTRDISHLAPSPDNPVQNLHYLKAGRPLVAGDELETKALSRKLKGGGQTDTKEGKDSMSFVAALSVVLCRLAASISSYHSFSSKLVANYMAYLLASDLKRECFLVSYLAEPKLALAAAQDWNPQALVRHLLPTFQQALVGGAVSAGSVGELVAQVILLLAFDSACLKRKLPPGSCVLLKDVLVELLPADAEVDILQAIPADLRGAHVACGQFVKLCHRCSPHTIVQLAERHCGAAFRDRQPGVDLVVPIFAERTAALLVQVKSLCRQETPCPAADEACASMLPSGALREDRFDDGELAALDSSCVRVYFQLGSSQPSAVCKPDPQRDPESGAFALQLFGLASRCLRQDGVDLTWPLQALLTTSHQLEGFLRDQAETRRSSKFALAPHSDVIENIRRLLPFVIDEDRDWDDLTLYQIQAYCKANRIRMGRRNKKALVDMLAGMGRACPD